ncbi:MAG: 16S rRNA (guanine(966)-N(2))-methyltransferase RsmD [Methylobacterium sp.]|jgi:16S rRNA (guanine966-N2)-methyltransferase|nr:16S rRNA (guanine(966)-N(2))-methyltransferase RsmD [Methylobacterium sp.]MCA3601327.1 16S rRNA (guanine(966)-N(2))-methyltransferase RsmD [Methylobacterium sp.]MCA3605703.1 16S rRNA (guanine(966)-N(2))-methyltransferase RsmD [Methylobacterium sp.]MCA3608345.1 16S rRNA (guanine(966)-N(2))-methyltransferase RsmD [Methylobacterium sp.]MCA3610883.1 16S rRNA (guanine(966)-N(2))-methyltransferase RsmD [Methylobacterium sp.]
MRIVGGAMGGRSLKGPSSDAIRPTSDRMRESMFNILTHGIGFELRKARVLDLFAGTGANALEAISRGAGYAVLVDIGAEARGLQRANVEALGLGGVTRILRRDATRLGPVSPFEPFDLVFCDPPYGRGLGEAALDSAIAGGWLKPGAMVVLEERANWEAALPVELEKQDHRKAGETQLLFSRFAG